MRKMADEPITVDKGKFDRLLRKMLETPAIAKVGSQSGESQAEEKVAYISRSIVMYTQYVVPCGVLPCV